MPDINSIADERLPVEPDLLVAVMSAERSWAVPSNRADPFASPIRPIRLIGPKAGPTENQKLDDQMNTDNIERIAQGTRGYWACMSPEQRSAEIKRRRQVAAAKRAGTGSGTGSAGILAGRGRAARRRQAPASQPEDIQVSRIGLHSLTMEYQRRITVLKEVAEWIAQSTE